GENVSASQVEGFVLGLFARGTLDAQAVVAQRHAMLGEVPVLFAVRGPGCALSEDEIRVAVLEGCTGLADFKRPRAVYFLDELPKATLDKVAKNKLRELADEISG
ncbi:MAG: AMP-dependent synthetase, partial [Mycobacteriaceae bacterium]